MKFCSNCGNSIRESEKCCSICGEPIEAETNFDSSSDTVSYPVPAASQAVKKRSDTGVAAVFVVIFITAAILIVAMISYKVSDEENEYSSYNTVLDELAEGLTKADGKAICKTMLTDEMMNHITQKQFDSMSETISILNSTVSVVTGEEAEWSFKEKSSVKLSDDKIDSIKYYYSSHLGVEIEISEAYQIKAKMKFGSQTDHVYINVIKVPDAGWKVSEEFLSTVLGQAY